MGRPLDAHWAHLRKRVARGRVGRERQQIAQRPVPEAGAQVEPRQRRFEQKDRTAVGPYLLRDRLAGRVEYLARDASLHDLGESLEHLRHRQSLLAIAVPFVEGCSLPSRDKCIRSPKLGLPIQTERSKSLRFLFETT